jgi:hypothetical protein
MGTRDFGWCIVEADAVSEHLTRLLDGCSQRVNFTGRERMRAVGNLTAVADQFV